MFVYRNYTVENLFPEEAVFSGYDDVSHIPDSEPLLVWCFQVPIGFETEIKLSAVEAMWNRLLWIVDGMQPSQTLVVCRLLNLFDVRTTDGDHRLSNAVAAFNTKAQELALSNPKVKFLDISEYFSQFPKDDRINWRFYFISQMVVAPSVAAGFKDWFEYRIKQINGVRKKCLVLDLDNTLWGGILGEDGIEGIKIGGDYPGNAFLYFQEALIELSKIGVILTVCSKNNESDVLEAWSKNPFIKLNQTYISAYRINWNNKADNIRELAAELNIGLDSMVFVDDNPAERELVRQQLPMVAVPEFPQKPYGLMTLYQTLVKDYFRTYELTEEDKQKTAQYKANAQRAQASAGFTNLTDYIKSLDIQIKLIPADKFNISRIAQMTQKTNQFNLTTQRYTEADISAFVEKGVYVYCISVSDKFGDNGITGAVIINRNGNVADIDSLLLSCRILGKGIEDVFFKAMMNILKKEGMDEVRATYLPTAKNAQVANFYDNQGMTLVSESKDGQKQYTLRLCADYEIQDYYNITLS